jgi:glycosyltransferase involved in cell wall biosynthesis
MRIAFVSAVFPPTRGGMCTVAGAEALELSHMHDVTVFTLQTDNPRKDLLEDRAHGFETVRLRGLPRISLGGFVPQLLWKLRSFDAVYAHLPAYGFMEVLILWKLITRKRLVVTVHMDPIGSGLYRMIFKLERFVLRALIGRADAVRVSTEHFSKDSLFNGAARKKISIIPFGIDIRKFVPSTKEKGSVFLFVGRLSRTHYFKGVELLLRAFKSVVEKNAAVELLIVGDGDERKNYERVCEKLKLTKNVHFLGAVSDEELPQIYARATTFVLPSTDTSETFGLVLLEAMACGVPVIASRLPGVDSVVADGFSGRLIEPGNEKELVQTMIEADQNRETWKNFGVHARERACEYGDWKGIAAKISSLL